MSSILGKEPVKAFKVRVAHDLAELADLWPRTNHSRRVRSYAFQCADILEAWCDTIGRARGTQPLFVAILDEIERPILLLPLGIEHWDRMRILRFLDGGTSDYNAPVVFEPIRDWRNNAIERLWQKLIKVLPPFDIALFDKMPADVCGVPNPVACLRGVPSNPSGHILNITTSWDEFAATQLPYKREAIIQRRRLGKLGQVEFTLAESEADRRRILEAMMRQKSQHLADKEGINWLDRPGFKQYYHAIVERLAWPRGPLVLTALEVNKEVISTNCGFLSNKRFVGIVTSFEGGEWRRFSAGRLLLEDLLIWNFAHGSTAFDFGLGDEDYKRAYCDQTIPLYNASIPTTLVGRIYAYQRGRDTAVWKLLRRIAMRTAG